ncbi:hypothetical protein K456DRAFT_1230530 [Colletotrichum gloeosporioides 23]|nr:hypothetical protein K456DRAFT_1230530 [Colletotrichum gloeosporioides 23]
MGEPFTPNFNIFYIPQFRILIRRSSRKRPCRSREHRKFPPCATFANTCSWFISVSISFFSPSLSTPFPSALLSAPFLVSFPSLYRRFANELATVLFPGFPQTQLHCEIRGFGIRSGRLAGVARHWEKGTREPSRDHHFIIYGHHLWTSHNRTIGRYLNDFLTGEGNRENKWQETCTEEGRPEDDGETTEERWKGTPPPESEVRKLRPPWLRKQQPKQPTQRRLALPRPEYARNPKDKKKNGRPLLHLFLGISPFFCPLYDWSTEITKNIVSPSTNALTKRWP